MVSKRQIKRILLIFPPTTFNRESVKVCCSPLGIAYLASVLKDEFDVKLLDASIENYQNEVAVDRYLIRFGLSYEEIKRRISEFHPEVVGVSCLYSNQLPAVRQICKLTKEVNKDIITLIGGTHPTFLPEKCMEDRNIDFIILSEGEHTIRDLITRINNSKSFYDLDGLVFRDNGKIQINPKTKFIKDINNIPYPARELLPMQKYFDFDIPMGVISERRPQTTIMTSRGCLARCTFCSSGRFWGNRYRARSPENVLKEIEYLIKEYGIREIKFIDDNLTLDRERAKRIFSGIIERKMNLRWNTPNGIALWTLDDELLKLMKVSGCYEITLAFESGDQDVLNHIVKKPVDLKKVKLIVKKVKEYGIGTYGFFIIGFPGETKEQIKRTFKFADSLRLDRISAFIANPLPGSEMLDICKERGYIDDDYSFEEADYFKARFETPQFKYIELEKMRRRWFFRYNFGLFIRHPIKFIIKYRKFIINKPRAAFEVLSKIHKSI